MYPHDIFRVRGTLVLLKFDRQGKIVEETRICNLIVNQGLEYTSKLLNGVSTTPFKYIAIGSDDTPPQVTDVSLSNEVMREAASCIYEADFKAKLTAVFNFTSFTSVKESGIFDSSSGGHMLSRVTFATKNFNAGEFLGIVWTIEITRS